MKLLRTLYESLKTNQLQFSRTTGRQLAEPPWKIRYIDRIWIYTQIIETKNMAKLKSIKLIGTSNSGEKLEVLCEVSVTDAGVFSINIPDYLEELAEKLIKNPYNRTLVLDRPRTNLRVSGRDLNLCEGFTKEVINEYLRCETTSEFVIAYNHNVEVKYVKDDDGVLYPNGNAVHEKYNSNKAHWNDQKHSHDQSKFYAVGIAARVLIKTTFKRNSSVLIKYTEASNAFGSNSDLGEYGNKLNSFVRVHLPFDSKGRLELTTKIMPYSEASAKFFYGVMMSMCQLADNLDTFFGNSENLNKAIQQQSFLLIDNNEKNDY